MNDEADRLNRLARGWDDAAEGYEAYFVPRFAPWVREAVSAISATDLPAGPILVPCCGTFPELDVIVEQLPRRGITGIDLSAEMVRLARERAQGLEQVDVIQGDAATLDPRWTDECAAIVSVFGLQQLPAPGPALASWAGTLRPGGRLSVIYWPDTAEPDDPFRLLSEAFGRSAPDYDEKSYADVLTDGLRIERDELIRFPMHHPSAAAFFDAFTQSGPMRTFVNTRSNDYIRSVRQAFIARAPSGVMEHQPAARHIVATRLSA